MTTPTAVSIGYEGRTPAQLIARLQAQGVTDVIDVRELPLSRRPGFSKTPLSQALEAAGIRYTHLRIAGNPFRAQKADMARCLARYRRHLATHPDVARVVATHLNGSPVAFLCFERTHGHCHRSILLEAVAAITRGLRVITE